MKNTRIVKLLLVEAIVCGRTAFAQSLSFSRSDIDTGLSLSGSVIEGDFNGDGKPDILVGEYAPPLPPLRAYLLLGNGNGTFKPPTLVVSSCCSAV